MSHQETLHHFLIRKRLTCRVAARFDQRARTTHSPYGRQGWMQVRRRTAPLRRNVCSVDTPESGGDALTSIKRSP
jgi:hypothetical protein